MIENEFNNFLFDNLISESKYKELIYKETILKKIDAKSFFNEKQIKLYEHIFKNTKDKLYKIFLIYKGKRNKITDVKYHKKFGWTVISNEIPAFLGKCDFSQLNSLKIGSFSYFSGSSRILGKDNLFVGAFSSIADNQTFFSSNSNHPTHYASTYNFKSNDRIIAYNKNFDIEFLPTKNKHNKNQISIGNDVWIGRNCTILNGVNVADGTVLGANTVLAKDTKPYGIYIGNPAQLKSYRYSDEIIKKLLEISWWDWSLNKIKSNKEFFSLNLKNSKAFDIDKLVK